MIKPKMMRGLWLAMQNKKIIPIILLEVVVYLKKVIVQKIRVVIEIIKRNLINFKDDQKILPFAYASPV